MSRPYFDKSITELEAAYQANASDVDLCKTLLDELEHRSTQRALKLKSKIAAANDVTTKEW